MKATRMVSETWSPTQNSYLALDSLGKSMQAQPSACQPLSQRARWSLYLVLTWPNNYRKSLD